MKRMAAVVGALALMGLIAWSVSSLGQATAQGPSDDASVRYVCDSGCGQQSGSCHGNSAKCEGPCKDGKGCEGCQGCKDGKACEGCKDGKACENCKDRVDADGDGKCDKQGSDKGGCHGKSGCPGHKAPRGGQDREVR